MPNQKSTSGKGDGGQQEVQDAYDAEQAQGFRGTRPDATPLDNYTLSGVTSGATTPESAPVGEPGSARLDPAGVYGGADGRTLIATDEPGATVADGKQVPAESKE